MDKIVLKVFLLVAVVSLPLVCAAEPICLDCHKKITPQVVRDWQLSKHNTKGIDCTQCHGDKHQSETDVAKAEIPTPDTCAKCHDKQVRQYRGGKHAFGWAAMKQLPLIHWQPLAGTESMQKGCGVCHKVGVKSAQEIQDLKKSGQIFGNASCDSCHTRHAFSVQEAKQPQACQTCHVGLDGPQWEMYSVSKHGVRYLLKQNRTLPEDIAAPTCQTCHMQDGNHAVRTAWGFFAFRLPMPEDEEWAADRTLIMQQLGLLGADGNPTETMKTVKEMDVFRLTNEEWQKDRDKMVKTCHQCHSVNFVNAEMAKGDQIIKTADHLMAEGLRIVDALYRDGLLKRPEAPLYPFPGLTEFPAIEQKLFFMLSQQRMRAFQGAFHSNLDYTYWQGLSAMQRSLTEIKEMAAEIREKAAERTLREEEEPE
ncbi:MAG TPA: multiheme c-type cytochrome [Thermodesulfovibrionales bacterium]|nr:multiheme c-type cytochrome [Thermodesulfovibrionales bacterium]